MKEEGEITDDDEDKQFAEMAQSRSEMPRLRFTNGRKREANERDMHSVSTHNDMLRSSDSHRSHGIAVSALKESSPVPMKKTKPYSKDVRTSVPPVTASSTRSSPSPSHRRSERLHPSYSQIISSDHESPVKEFTSQNSQTSASSYKVGESSDSDVITIYDSDENDGYDVEVIDGGAKQEDEDLDELQLRLDALDSAVKYNEFQGKTSTSFDEDSTSVLDSQEQRPEHNPCLSSISSMPDVHHGNDSVQSSIQNNFNASNGGGVSGIVIPSIANGCYWNYNQLGSDSSHLTHHNGMSFLSQQNSAMLSLAFPLGDSTAVTNPASPPVHQEVRQSDVDNYDEVEMDLDSGNSLESPEVISCEQPAEGASYTPEQNHESLESSALLTDSVPSLKFLRNSYDNPAVSQSTVSCPAVDDSNNNNVATNRLSEDMAVCTAASDKIPNVTHTKTSIVDPCISDNLQPQRKVEDADKKSELLLRAAVLQSLSSKRQQQQQSQLDTAPSVSRERLIVTKPQVAPHFAKRTVTVTSNSPLPVHQPVVISLTGESSDSGESLEVGDACEEPPSAVASSSLVGISSNLDKVLREIRRATEEPKSEYHDMALGRQVETTSAVKFEEKHSDSEPRLANEYVSNKTSSLLTFSAHKPSLITNPLMSCNKATEDSAQLNIKENAQKRTAICNLEREMSCERRKLQQQKTALSKAKLRMARKKEQVSAAEKRVKKLREQLIAAEKIAASSKKQLQSLHEETLAMLYGTERQQQAVSRLEAARKMLVASTSENACNSENFLPSENSSVSSQHKTVSSAVVSRQNLVSGFRLSTSVPGDSEQWSVELCNMKQTQVNHPARMTVKVQTSHRPKKFRYYNATGVCRAEGNTVLVNDKSVTRELTPEANVIKISQTAEQQTASCTGSAGREARSVNHALNLDLCPVSKPSLFVSKSDTLTQQETSSIVSDDADSSHISSASLDKLASLSEKKIKQISHHYNTSLNKNLSLGSLSQSSQLFSSDPVFSFHFPIIAIPSVSASSLAAASQSDAFEVGDCYEPYRSSLLCFRSCRFSDFYERTGLTVSSETFSHKLDCRVPLCQFDLMGKCLDENCRWQHQSDYSLNNKERLLDIVSYYPSVVDIDSSVPVSKQEQLLNLYVDMFLKGACSQLPHSEQCLHLMDNVKSAAGLQHPHAVCTSARRWKLRRNKQRCSASDRSDLPFSVDDISEMISPESLAAGSLAADDVRYWMVVESDQIKHLEEAVSNTPADDSLWIKLAYAKMMEMKVSASHDEYVGYGLNVLTRAVEANPCNSNLWRHYLELYMERTHAEKDISSLFEQAVQYAPSYEFFWKYLQLPVSYSQKMEICRRLRQYLCSPMCRDDADIRSHHLLETVLYQAALCTTSGRFKNGLQIIQAIVQSKASVIWLTLTACDRVVMWLSFIHLYECRQLPEMLFDPANSNPGAIVRKEAFIVPFQAGTKTRISYETLLQLFQSAFSACDKDVKPGADAYDEYLQWIAALYRSRILLELSCHGWQAALQLAEQVVQQRPYLVDVWLFRIQLIIANSSNGSDSITEKLTVNASVASIVEQAVSSNPHSVSLFLAGVSALIQCGDIDGALNYAERCSISFFEVDDLDASSIDPNLLYCCLLGQPVPPRYKVPPLCPSVSRHLVADEHANLWLCYCLLLDLQGAHDQASETYHVAFSCLRRMKDIRRLWLAFLKRTVAVISHQLPWLSPGAISSDQKRKLWQQFESDIDRALVSFPVRRSLPNSTQTWDDYSSHNEIIQLYISCLSDEHRVQDAYEKYLHQMPGNIWLVLTAIGHLLHRDAMQLCHGSSLMALHSCPRSAVLWNVFLRLCQQSTDNVGLVRSVYAKAVKMLPFNVGLWKSYVIFEILNKSRAHVQELLDECRRLQVNIAGFVDSLLK